jgi:hypothetical protein
MSKVQLSEGMREGDLADLVLPLISIDEYSSKLDNDQAIVIGFYVHEEMAAKDLNRFLQKSAVPLLGTDVSPAPDQHGYYMVFVELMNNERLPQNMQSILEEIHGLVDIDNWQLRVRDHKDLIPFSMENIEMAIVKLKRETKKTEVVEFLQPSALMNAQFAGALLILEGAGESYTFDFIDFASIPLLMQNFKLTETGVAYDLRTVAKTNKIGRMLGENWEVSRIGKFMLLHTDRDPRGLLLKL